MSSDEGRGRRIEFVRPDPTKFVLLVARTGRGTGNVAGTESFKPPGTEWATEQDVRDAGFVPLADAVKALQSIEFAAQAAQAPEALRQAIAKAYRDLGAP